MFTESPSSGDRRLLRRIVGKMEVEEGVAVDKAGLCLTTKDWRSKSADGNLPPDGLR